MEDLFKLLIQSCNDEWNIGFNHLDNSDNELILPESIQKIIDEILVSKLKIPTSFEIIDYMNTNPRFNSWSGKEQYGTCYLIHYVMNKLIE